MLSVLATTMTDQEKQSIKKEGDKFIKTGAKLNEKFKKFF